MGQWNKIEILGYKKVVDSLCDKEGDNVSRGRDHPWGIIIKTVNWSEDDIKRSIRPLFVAVLFVVAVKIQVQRCHPNERETMILMIFFPSRSEECFTNTETIEHFNLHDCKYAPAFLT